jgi:hypothetical protein
MEIFSDIIHGVKCDDDTLVEAKQLYSKHKDAFEKHPGWEKDNHSLSDHTFQSNIIQQDDCGKIAGSISNALFEYLKMLGHSPSTVNGFSITESWLTHTINGESARQHNHGNIDVAGVYYIQSNAETDGDLYFMAPESVRYCHKLYRMIDNQMSFPSEEGTMILFPGWLNHGTRMHTGNTPRISLSFNLSLNYVS